MRYRHFSEWLVLQSYRSDEIGKLARIAKGNDWPYNETCWVSLENFAVDVKGVDVQTFRRAQMEYGFAAA